MTSFFPLNSSLRQTSAGASATTITTTSSDNEPFPPLNRHISTQPSYPTTSNQTRTGMPGRNSNGYGPHGDPALSIHADGPGKGGASERNGSMSGGPPFDMGRSPPGGKNTKHVPCKFFRQGACQAGNACPFSHTLDPLMQNAPCKYFMKGNCKFGAKCALAHYLPDGRRVNRSELEYSMGTNGRSFNLGGRIEPPLYSNQDSALANSILAQQQFTSPDMFPPQYPYPDLDDGDTYAERRYAQAYQMTPIEAALNSPPGSHFGSPPDDFQLPRSPVENLRTALNAPLPQSFDANSISHIAKYGPLGQSLPDKFGFKSPTGSLPKKVLSPPEATSAIRSSSKVASPLASSPQTQDDSLSARVVPVQKLNQSRGLPSSVPKSTLIEDWEERFNVDTDLLPNSLHDEVLTPQEKMRRLSRPDQEPSAPKDRSNALAIPGGASGKVSSLPAAGSPSRFRALWEEQREKKNAEGIGNPPGAFGHVGSPLREAWMPNNSSNSPGNASMSGISQQMLRMKLDRTESVESNPSRSQLSGLRQPSAPNRPFDRTISSPKILGKKLDEDGEGAFFFPMDDDSKRSSMIWGGKSPVLEPVRDSFDSTSSKENKPSGLDPNNGIKSMFPYRKSLHDNKS